MSPRWPSLPQETGNTRDPRTCVASCPATPKANQTGCELAADSIGSDGSLQEPLSSEKSRTDIIMCAAAVFNTDTGKAETLNRTVKDLFIQASATKTDREAVSDPGIQVIASQEGLIVQGFINFIHTSSPTASPPRELPFTPRQRSWKPPQQQATSLRNIFFDPNNRSSSWGNILGCILCLTAPPGRKRNPGEKAEFGLETLCWRT